MSFSIKFVSVSQEEEKRGRFSSRVFKHFFLVPRREQTRERVMREMSETRIQKRREWLANVKKKSGAKHEIQGACPHSE